MFRTLINDAKSAAGSVVAKYAVRASVAVPFLVAAGFGIAALTLVLVERYGSLTAYGIMAGGFAALGLIASLILTGSRCGFTGSCQEASSRSSGVLAT